MADTFGLEIYASNKLAFAGPAKTLTIILSLSGAFLLPLFCEPTRFLLVT